MQGEVSVHPRDVHWNSAGRFSRIFTSTESTLLTQKFCKDSGLIVPLTASFPGCSVESAKAWRERKLSAGVAPAGPLILRQ